ncbi:hypothetical protein [Aquimarina sp. AU474]|uniref:hypothetical protein n=1 Tax=Aquimarina sp. AU474 TaxID=2108529 RepID=UPI000D695DC2|nr:hypothetical protein [Aquimarina sp. AU474]
MKTIFFTLILLFTFSTISAQEIAIEDTKTNSINIEASKANFFQALVEKNNFNIKIKNYRKEVSTNSKSEFYNLLLEKNGFKAETRKITRLANNTSTEVETSKENTTLVALLP